MKDYIDNGTLRGVQITRAEREDTRLQAVALLNRIENDGRAPDKDEQRQLDKWAEDMDRFDQKLKLITPTREQCENDTPEGDSRHYKNDPSGGEVKIALPARGKKYRDMFCGGAFGRLNTGDFKSFGEYVGSWE